MTETINDLRASTVAEIAAMFEGEAQPAPEVKDIPEATQPEEEGDGLETATGAESEEGVEPDEGDEGEAEGDDLPPVDPPHFWSKDEKERFSSLPRDAQELVKAKIEDNERYINQQKQEAAEAKKASAKEIEALQEIGKRISSAAEVAEARFADRWQGFDAQYQAKLAREDPAKYTALKAEHDADREALSQATAAKEAQERIERERWAQEEGAKLRDLVPELFGTEGRKNSDDLTQYLVGNGVPQEGLADLGAVAWQVAYKAMLYDRAKTAKPIATKSSSVGIPSKSAPPSRPSQKTQERDAIVKRAYGGNGQKADRAAMAKLLIADGYV